MKKKLIIICSISALAIAGIVTAVLLLNNDKNSNTTKNTKTNTETFTVTFDSNGGSKVDSIKVECGKELSLPENPTKEGYTFLSWIDKNETPIYDKALLSCEDITLKANWEKETEQTADSKKYKCPSGYTLSGNKCIMTASPTEKCPSGHKWSNKVNKCVAQTTATSACPEGYTWSDKAGKCYITTNYTKECPYMEAGGNCYKTWVSGIDYDTNEECAEHNGDLIDGRCYMYKVDPTITCPSGYELVYTNARYGIGAPKQQACAKETNKQEPCPSGYKLYHSDPNFGAGDRCVKLSEKEKTCPSGYTLNGSNCIKTIDATSE